MSSTVGTSGAELPKLLSTGLFLLAAGVSFVLSVTLWFSGNEQQGIFVGLWVPSILALGALLKAPGRQR